MLNKHNGFTFIEIFIALGIFCFLTLISSWSLHYFRDENEQQVIIDDLKSVISFSRVQAFSQGREVVLMPVDESLSWSKGVKLLASSQQKKLIYQWNWHHPHWELTWKGVSSTTQIRFSENPMKAITNGQFVLTNLRTHKQIQLILNRLGRIKTVTV